MRCKSCDVILAPYELTKKDKETGEFLDLCGNCLTYSNEASYNISLDVDIDFNEAAEDLAWQTQL